MYVVSGVIVFLIALNYILGFALYKKATNKEFYNNVKNIPSPKERNILPEPKYVFGASILPVMTVTFAL